MDLGFSAEFKRSFLMHKLGLRCHGRFQSALFLRRGILLFPDGSRIKDCVARNSVQDRILIIAFEHLIAVSDVSSRRSSNRRRPLTFSRVRFINIVTLGLVIAQLFQLANKEAIEIVSMRIIASREVHLWVETVLPELLEARLTERQPSINDFHVTVVQRILHHSLVLFYSESAGGVDDVAPSRAVGVHDVDGRQDELLLERAALADVALVLLIPEQKE